LKPDQKAEGYYEAQLTGVFDIRFEIYNSACTLLKPPLPKVLLYAGTPNSMTVEMKLIVDESLGSYSYQLTPDQ
jgi:hypothetical protein